MRAKDRTHVKVCHRIPAELAYALDEHISRAKELWFKDPTKAYIMRAKCAKQEVFEEALRRYLDEECIIS